MNTFDFEELLELGFFGKKKHQETEEERKAKLEKQWEKNIEDFNNFMKSPKPVELNLDSSITFIAKTIGISNDKLTAKIIKSPKSNVKINSILGIDDDESKEYAINKYSSQIPEIKNNDYVKEIGYNDEHSVFYSSKSKKVFSIDFDGSTPIIKPTSLYDESEFYWEDVYDNEDAAIIKNIASRVKIIKESMTTEEFESIYF